MIRSFVSKEAEKIFRREYSLKLPGDIQGVIMRKLWMLDAAASLDDLRVPPANQLKRLKGRWKDHYSIRVNDQWRIIFIWQDGSAISVRIIDYH